MATSIKAQDLRPGDSIGDWVLADVHERTSLNALDVTICVTWQRHDYHTHTLEVCRRWYEWDELCEVTERRPTE